jgi:hypothetical protein
MWKRVEHSVFDQRIKVVCEHVEASVRNLGGAEEN